MEEITNGDYSQRLSNFEHILEMMVAPSTQLIDQLQTELPTYLSDISPNCQKVAIQILDQFFRTPDIVYDIDGISTALIRSCLCSSQPVVDASIPMVLQCLKADPDSVSPKLFDNLPEKPPRQIIATLKVLSAFLASIGSRDHDDIERYLDIVQPLANHSDMNVKKTALSTINEIKLVLGDSLEVPLPEAELPEVVTEKSTTNSWLTDMQSPVWKDRKNAFMELAAAIEDGYQFPQVEQQFLNAIGDEKHIACSEASVLVITKAAQKFPQLIAKHLRDYLMPIINLMKDVRQTRRINLQEALDTIAFCLPTSPYENPFFDFLLKILTSEKPKLREEGINFVVRCSIQTVPPVLIETLNQLTRDPLPAVRDAAEKAVSTILNKQVSPRSAAQSKKPVRTRSPDVRKSNKKKVTHQTDLSQFNNWVRPSILVDMTNSEWDTVIRGLENLRSQYEEDRCSASSVLVGLVYVFTKRTFTNRVMNQLLSDVLFYISTTETPLSDDSLIQVITFCVEKLTDKRLEHAVSDILDEISQKKTPQFVFQALYPHLNAKNPAIVLRITSYFVYFLGEFNVKSTIKADDFIEKIKALQSHPDAVVRKNVSECIEHFSGAEPKDSLEKVVQLEDRPKTAKRSELPAPRAGRNPSPQRQLRRPSPQKRPPQLIPTTTLELISRGASQIDCRRGFDAAEKALTQQKMLQASDLNELAEALRPWFTDTSHSIASEATKVATLILQTIDPSQLLNLPKAFHTDFILLLNSTQKIIRTAACSGIEISIGKSPMYVTEVINPTYQKLKGNARSLLVGVFIENCNQFPLIITATFLPTVILDKTSSIKQLEKTLIDTFLSIEGAWESILDVAGGLSSARKNAVIARIQAKSSTEELTRQKREEELGQFITLKVINREVPTETLIGYVTNYFQRLFPNLDPSSQSEHIASTISYFDSADLDQIRQSIDVVFLWWSAILLQVSDIDDFEELMSFMHQFIHRIVKQNIELDSFELGILLPAILEYIGHEPDKWNNYDSLVCQLADINLLMNVLVQILGLAIAVGTIETTVRFLESLLPKNPDFPHFDELKRTAQKLFQAVSERQKRKPHLFEVVQHFMNTLNSFESQQETFPLNQAFIELVESPTVTIYGLISALASEKYPAAAAKIIYGYLTTDRTLVEPHIFVLEVVLVEQFHDSFSPITPPRFIKYLTLDLLTIFSDVEFARCAGRHTVVQLVNELVIHLADPIPEGPLRTNLGNLFDRLVENCTVFTLDGILSIVTLVNANESVKWFGIALEKLQSTTKTLLATCRKSHIKAALTIAETFLQNPVSQPDIVREVTEFVTKAARVLDESASPSPKM